MSLGIKDIVSTMTYKALSVFPLFLIDLISKDLLYLSHTYSLLLKYTLTLGSLHLLLPLPLNALPQVSTGLTSSPLTGLYSNVISQ